MSYYTMDGNFQLKRRNNKSNNAALFGTTQKMDRFWGEEADVEIYNVAQEKNDVRIAICVASIKLVNNFKNEQCTLQDLDSEFKAIRNNRKFNQRFDENGVFALCCGRHGVPLKFFDIQNGEG